MAFERSPNADALGFGDLKGRVAIISGATRGIGKACALALAREGCHVCVAAKSVVDTKELPGTIYSVADEITALGARTGSLWVCVLTHTVNNTVALAASKFSDVSMDAEEGLPWYYIPIGWVIAGFVIYGIWRLTKDQAACLGPARDAAQA